MKGSLTTRIDQLKMEVSTLECNYKTLESTKRKDQKNETMVESKKRRNQVLREQKKKDKNDATDPANKKTKTQEKHKENTVSGTNPVACMAHKTDITYNPFCLVIIILQDPLPQ